MTTMGPKAPRKPRTKKTTKAMDVLQRLKAGGRPVDFKAQGQSVRVFAVSMTPEDAHEVLKFCNHHNRDVRTKKVKDYTQEMEEGRWRLQNTIILTDRGRLMDGQHRIRACENSGVVVPFLVEVHADLEAEEVFGTVDDGVPRSKADWLKTAGVPNSKRVAPVLELENRYRQSCFESPFVAASMTKKGALRLYYDIGEELIKRAFDAVPNELSKELGCPKAFADWLSLQLIQIDQASAELFFEFVCRPDSLKDTDPLRVLNRKLIQLLSQAHKRRGVGPRVYGALMIKAWNFHHRQEEIVIGQLKYAPTSAFPIIEGSEAPTNGK